MRTTLRIDDDLAERVKDLARREDITFGRMLNRVLRAGLISRKAAKTGKRPFKQSTFDMGEPAVNLDKALAITAALDDDETARKIALGK